METTVKIMGYEVVISRLKNNFCNQFRVDCSKIPPHLLWWKPTVLQYLESEGFFIPPPIPYTNK